MGKEVSSSGHLSFRENKRTKGLCKKIRQAAERDKRNVNDYLNLLLVKSLENSNEKNLTFTPQALFEICEEIVKKCKKCLNQDPSMKENIMWDSLTTDWLDWIEDKSIEALKTK
jgi:hypothetical protein